MEKHSLLLAVFIAYTAPLWAAEEIFTEANYPAPHHPVPINKGLSEEWIDSLYNQGEKPTYTGDAKVAVNGKKIAAKSSVEDSKIVITLKSELVLEKGDVLTVLIK